MTNQDGGEGMKITVNWMWIITLPFAAYLIGSGKASWWIVLLIYLTQMEISTKFSYRRKP